MRNSYRVRGIHIFREYLWRFSDKHKITGGHASVESRVHFLEITCKVSLVKKIELQRLFSGCGSCIGKLLSGKHLLPGGVARGNRIRRHPVEHLRDGTYVLRRERSILTPAHALRELLEDVRQFTEELADLLKQAVLVVVQAAHERFVR